MAATAMLALLFTPSASFELLTRPSGRRDFIAVTGSSIAGLTMPSIVEAFDGGEQEASSEDK